MKKINRLRVVLSFIGILVLIWGVLCVFSIRTCIGLKNPMQVNTKDSSALRAGNIVSVEYDYIFDHGLSVGFAFGRNTYYEVIKIKGKDEFVFGTLREDYLSYLEEKPYFTWFDDVKEYEVKESYIFLGKVRKINNHIEESLEHNIVKTEESIYKCPNTVSNTNFDYYIQYIEPKDEVNRMMGRVVIFLLLIIVWFIIRKKLKQEKEAYQFYLQEERAKERYRIHMNLEKQIKQSSCQSDEDFLEDLGYEAEAKSRKFPKNT